jgi:hypothetical protein
VHAGGSYLSQSSPQISLPVGDESTAEVLVQWPDGTQQRTTVDTDAKDVVDLNHSAAR